jgi:demethylmenaquinone methyltransferase/2-methoxy-6-polyprenyl-1,4-benzoquinol methylase
VLDKSPETIKRMFAEIAPRYDRANRVLSMRLDVGWRRYVARHLLARPGRVLDLATGTGDLGAELARTGHDIIGTDFTVEMLAAAHHRLRFVAGDALALPFPAKAFDGVAIGWGIRNFADALAGLREIHRVLRPGGSVGVIDFSTPARAIRPFYDLYFNRFVPMIGKLVTGSDQAYRYLPTSVNQFPEGDAFLEMMKAAGFQSLTTRRLSGGIVTFYRGVKP